jgi:hypothetical protein
MRYIQALQSKTIIFQAFSCVPPRIPNRYQKLHGTKLAQNGTKMRDGFCIDQSVDGSPNSSRSLPERACDRFPRTLSTYPFVHPKSVGTTPIFIATNGLRHQTTHHSEALSPFLNAIKWLTRVLCIFTR